MKELGDAINNSLSDSDEIAKVISRIKAGGYDVLLVLEATIGFNRRDDEEEVETGAIEVQPVAADLHMTAQDAKFLKSLRIKVDDADRRR